MQIYVFKESQLLMATHSEILLGLSFTICKMQCGFAIISLIPTKEYQIKVTGHSKVSYLSFNSRTNICPYLLK